MAACGSDRPVVALAVVAAALGVALPGCGHERILTQTVTRTVTAPSPSQAKGGPALARTAAAPGEVLLTGDSAPKTFGPIDLEPGIYKFRFEQFAPDSPGLNFKTEASPIAVMLNRRPRTSAPDSQLVVNSSDKQGENVINASGRYYVDVTSADHSYVLRFTPQP